MNSCRDLPGMMGIVREIIPFLFGRTFQVRELLWLRGWLIMVS